jgi:hypothetical protein
VEGVFMYEVGQVLFIILNKRPQVIPVQVVEQVVRRSVSGEEIQYSVNVPAKDGDKVLELESIDGSVFEDAEDARRSMLDNATRTIDGFIEKAMSVASARFNFDSGANGVSELISGNKNENTQKAKVTLEDGTVANIILPDVIGEIS